MTETRRSKTGHKTGQAFNRQSSDATDRQNRRASRLAPDVLTYWTDLVRRAAPHVAPGTRPCDYGPWIAALRKAQGIPTPPERHHKADRFIDGYLELSSFAMDVGQPAWPEPRADLQEFALTFLEADVMLFRSGYAKRHLIRRLQCSRLTDAQVARIFDLLRRAVMDGTGLEEFREYKRLSAQLALDGRLPGWEKQLAQLAEGVVLTIDRADGQRLMTMVTQTSLADEDMNRLLRVNWLRPSKWGLVWPQMDQVVRAGKMLGTPEEQVRRNAFLMLQAILRQRGTI